MTRSEVPDGLDTKTVTYKGVEYTIRELTIDENDAIDDAGKDAKGATNDRLVSRLSLSKAIVDPMTSVDDIGKWGGKKYLTILRAFNEVNTLPVANPTLPDGSNAPTSPVGGG